MENTMREVAELGKGIQYESRREFSPKAYANSYVLGGNYTDNYNKVEYIMNTTERIENEILGAMTYLIYLEEQEETMRSIEVLEDGVNDYADDYEYKWQKQSSHLRGMLKVYAIMQGVKTSDMRSFMWDKYNASIKEETK